MTTTLNLDMSIFPTISLNQLNTQASLMERNEQKYLLHDRDLPTLLQALSHEFAVLQIGENAIFSYDNVYMDTQDLMCYHDHNNQQTDRIKIRTRQYTESELFFFECKHKRDGHMSKFRYQIPAIQHGVMDTASYHFVNELYQSIFQQTLGTIVFPSIGTAYQRITLCHQTKAEKITIDTSLTVYNRRKTDTNIQHPITIPNIVIIESKTTETKGIGPQIILQNGGVQSHACSKYCLGHNILGNVTQNNHFAPTLTLIQDIINAGQTLSKKTTITQPNYATAIILP